jgi:hypothetical protein
MSWIAKSGRTRFIGALLLIALIGLAAFIASPWHQHSRLSTQRCAYTSFEHASWICDAALPAPIAPALEAVALGVAGEPRPSEPTFVLPAPIRAPPSTLA